VEGPQDLGLPPSHPPLTSFLGVPFAAPARAFGWLYLADRLGAEGFTEEDEQLISTLAIQAGVAYDNLLFGEEIQSLSEEIRRMAAQLRLEVEQRRQVEAAMHVVQDQVHHLAVSSPAVIYSLKVEADLLAPTYVSENVRQLTGWTPAEALAPDWWLDHLHPDDWEQVLMGWDKLFARGQGLREYRFQRKEGGYIWVQDHCRVLRDGAGEPTEIVGVWIDITERRHRESQARALQRVQERVGRMRSPEEIGQVLEAVKEGLEALGTSFQEWGIDQLLETDAGPSPVRFHNTTEEGRAVEAILRLWREGKPVYRPGLERSDFSEEDVAFLGRLVEVLAEGFHRLDHLRNGSGA